MTDRAMTPPRYDILTLHPDMVRPMVTGSILGRAVRNGVLEVELHDIRDWAEGRHRTADDAPYGGGAGMVMKVDVVGRALEAVRRPDSHVILTSPGGRRFDQARARELARHAHLVLVTGHYEGIDARIEALVDEELSLGDFVLTGGEIAAVAIVDAVGRLVPGVLGNEQSVVDESFSHSLLEYPHYTRPREWRGMVVPEVLLSGHHAHIQRWRRAQAEARTCSRRPDLWAKYLSEIDGIVDESTSDE